MVNLVALVLIVMSSAQQSPPANDAPHASQAQSAPAAVTRKLTPEQKAWFAHAVDDILTGR